MTYTHIDLGDRAIGWLGRLTGALLTITILVFALSAMSDDEADIVGSSAPPVSGTP